jgi:signal transduction histidine kinase
MNSKQSPSASASLEQELLRLLAVQGRRVPIPVFLGAAMIAALVSDHVPAAIWAPWLTLVAVVLVVRWLLLGRLPTLRNRSDRERLRIAVMLSAINGIAHGLSVSFFLFIPEFERAIQSFVLVGLCAGAVATTAGYMPVFLAYLLPSLGSLSVLWAISPGAPNAGWIHSAMSFIIALFGLVLVALARDAFRLFRESFEIRLQQAETNRQLKTALDQAEAASRAKTRFLAAASHDLRQPMHTLSLFGAALALRPLDPRSREIAQHMNTALQALTSQLDALLDISKLDAGVVRVNRTHVQLSSFLDRICKEFEAAARAKALQMDLDCPRDAFVETDEFLFERIVRNLLDNAIKYTDAGHVSITAVLETRGITLSIADSGRGIPEAEQERVFEEFYQLENPERDRTRGLGLGLAIVKRLADLLQISLKMTSTPGRGTIFRIVLPPAASAASAAPASPPADLRDKHVLVVDNEAAVRLGMKTLLEAIGCRATLADGTEHAVAVARDDKPDVVLADLRLRGDDDGIATVRAIRKLYPRMPAILISGDTAPDRLREAEEAGIALLHKPVPSEILMQAISEACNS